MSTTVLSTIQAPATPSAAETPAATEPTTPQEGSTEAQPTENEASEASPVVEQPDPDLEIARKLENASKAAARARRHEAEMQRMRSELDAERRRLAEMRAEYEAALEDPIEHYLKKGKDPVEVAKRFAKPMSEEEKRIAKLEAKLEAEERARQERETAEQTRQRQYAQQRAWADFVRQIEPEEYPHLTSMYEPTEVPRLVQNLLSRPSDASDPESPTVREVFRERFGRDPTPKEIRDALEHEAEERATSLLERLHRKSPAQATPPGSPEANQEPTSLSNTHAQSSPSTRASTETREERLRRLKEELEAEVAKSE